VAKRDHVSGERDRDQEWSELIEEHRLAMPGTQVLFGFLLVLPFQRRFAELDTAQVRVYYAALLCAAAATVLLISPSVSHRIDWRQQDKEILLRRATVTAIAASVFLAAGMTASVYLITDFLFGEPATAVVTGLVACAFLLLWYVLPVLRVVRHRRDTP
jgi:Family of unknown function (DUF6328)